jgi:hypothetical protein
MYVVTVNRSGIDHKFKALGDLAKQLPATLANIAAKYFKPVLRRPHEVVFAVPHRVTAALIVFHLYKPSTFRRLKARGLRIPYRGL